MSPRNNTLKYPYFDILPITKARKGYSRRIAGTSAIQRLAKRRKKRYFCHTHIHIHVRALMCEGSSAYPLHLKFLIAVLRIVYDFQYTSDFLQRFAKYAVHVCVFVATIYIWEAALMPMACNALNDIMQHAAARQKQLRNYVCMLMLCCTFLYFCIYVCVRVIFSVCACVWCACSCHEFIVRLFPL